MARARVEVGVIVAVAALVAAGAAGTTRSASGSPSGAATLRASAADAARRAGPGVDRMAFQAGVEAYVWGFPLVTMSRTRGQVLCGIPVNTLINVPRLLDAGSRVVVTPNADTLYSSAFLDLRPGPMVLRVPAVRDRYYVFQFLDMYTNTIADVGTRTNGGRAGAYAIVGPGWHGRLPTGTGRITAPTPDVWVIGRTLAALSRDVAGAAAEQRRYRLQPLSGVTPPAGASAPACSPPSAPRPSFTGELATAIGADPPPPRDRPIVADLAAAGIRPGLVPNAAALATTEASRAAALEIIRRVGSRLTTARNGWTRLHGTGSYGTDYITRAVVAMVGLGANVPDESVYYFASTDEGGAPLSGAASYVIHFRPGQLPPIDPRAFWSISLYGPDHFFVANPVDRYAVGDRTEGLTRGHDGSLDVFVSHSPPPGHEGNWLPAPAGSFNLVLRAYLPGPGIRSGSWTPPAVRPG